MYELVDFYINYFFTYLIGLPFRCLLVVLLCFILYVYELTAPCLIPVVHCGEILYYKFAIFELYVSLCTELSPHITLFIADNITIIVGT